MSTATEDVRKFNKFDQELSNQLHLARLTVTRDDWMALSDIRPFLNENDADIDDVLADVN